MPDSSGYCTGPGFPRDNRLTTPGDYGDVFKQGIRSADRYFTVLYRPNSLSRARLGLAVPKRRMKHAVQRNRIKRVVRESFRHHQDRLSGLDVVVMVRRDLTGDANAVLFRALEGHWAAINKP